MEYKIGELSRLSGVSSRTLRYYEEIGLLCPGRSSSSGYRVYGERQVEKLQQILFYRSLGVELEQIRAILEAPGFDTMKALEGHLKALHREKERLGLLIENVLKTIDSMKGVTLMSDREKFEGFKKEKIKQNEKIYGEEIRRRYKDEIVDASNRKLMKLSEEEYGEWKELEQQIIERLKEMEGGDPASDKAQEICRMHEKWLSYCGGAYSREYHKGLGEMYAGDERFSAYYDAAFLGAAKFLKKAIDIYCK